MTPGIRVAAHIIRAHSAVDSLSIYKCHDVALCAHEKSA